MTLVARCLDLSSTEICSICCIIILCSAIWAATYRFWFHPLANFPGPFWRKISEAPFVVALVRGQSPQRMLRLHTRYGRVVRVAPNELTFDSAEAFRDIYGHRNLDKDKKFFSGMGEPTLLLSDQTTHAHIRKLMAHGFAESALRAQEAAIKDFLDTLMERLGSCSNDGSRAVDLVKWFEFFVFDVIAHLTYGESSDCLRHSHVHGWVKAVQRLGKPFALAEASERLPWFLKPLLSASCVDTGFKADLKTVTAISKAGGRLCCSMFIPSNVSQEKVDNRLNISPSIPNFMDQLVEEHHGGRMSKYQLQSNATFLMAAGSGTLAFQLSHVSYRLMSNASVLSRLTTEIRSKFAGPQDITILKTNTCTYLNACLNEALRLQPPAPITHPRMTPPEGMMIDGYFVPGQVVVGVPILAASRSLINFHEPEQFVPERWLGEDVAFLNDRREASQPFGFGPRDCLGRNIAMAEMRLVIARLVWHFDLEGCFPSDWGEQNIFLVWEKPALMAKLLTRPPCESGLST